VKTAGNPMKYAQQVRELCFVRGPGTARSMESRRLRIARRYAVQSRLTALLLALFAVWRWLLQPRAERRNGPDGEPTNAGKSVFAWHWRAEQ